ncbi:hypothetical protein PV327_002976 [Microctonus hyperodae]|uniref:Selenoprotein K n=1 Tax=Microctonus hyperodae TaxID=165561 RepID=A0AA39L0N7_MICHY|nr:hypothetical protein PV327_002976 [Microctonus hyperodae]
MTYISSNGTILQTKPWNVRQVFNFFENIFYGIAMFFNTLIKPNSTKYGSGYSRDYKPGSGPPRPPTKKIGGLNLKPTMNLGGCSSCARQ